MSIVFVSPVQSAESVSDRAVKNGSSESGRRFTRRFLPELKEPTTEIDTMLKRDMKGCILCDFIVQYIF